MTYNDYQITDEKSREIIRQKFDEKEGEELSDLRDILEKMHEQKKFLQTQDLSDNKNIAINILEKNIAELDSIIRKNTNKTSSFIDKIHKSALGQFSQTQPAKNPNVWGKIPHSNEIARHTPVLTPNPQNPPVPQEPSSPNNDIPLPQNSSDSVVSPPNNSIPSRNSSRRNPHQGNILSAFAKAFAINSRAFFSRKPKVNFNPKSNLYSGKNEIVVDSFRNRFHRITSQAHTCSPRKTAINNQIDLIRLLLLFIALRPHCRYCARISSITSNQFDVLTYLI
ncbi:MAG: hypothetical protein IJW59_00605 [Clostridia bacterium]|nr:hypothetical protein [Clostridia bacterium]